jgi:quercetin dioxygenase-like cupin family protein
MADSQDKEALRELRGHNIIKRAKDEGEVTQIANLQLLWKVRGPETGYQFSIYEMELQPKVGIPLHKHPYAEFFKVLEGEVSFARLDEKGEVEWVICGVGDSVNAPPNAPPHLPESEQRSGSLHECVYLLPRSHVSCRHRCDAGSTEHRK